MSQCGRLIPYSLTSFRLASLPFLLYSLFNEMIIIVYFLFLFSIGTDFLDGFAARKLGVASKSGAFFDVIADFVFIYVMFMAFVLKGFYPVWVLLLLVFAFEQFILTSIASMKIYDPIGKYYGSLLFGAVGLTLLFSGQVFFDIITFCLVIITSMTLASRLLYFSKRSV